MSSSGKYISVATAYVYCIYIYILHCFKLLFLHAVFNFRIINGTPEAANSENVKPTQGIIKPSFPNVIPKKGGRGDATVCTHISSYINYN